MCGIILIFSKRINKETNLSDLVDIFLKNIARRGPDSLDIQKFTTENGINLVFAASVLWLQGKYLTKQPVTSNDSIFIYNGDIFDGIPKDVRLENGDTTYFFNVLNNTENIYDSISEFQGPYAFIFFKKSKNQLCFGRDKFGRRSLLIGKSENEFILCSVAKQTNGFNFIELPSIGIFIWDFNTDILNLYPYLINQSFKSKLKELEEFLEISINIQKSEVKSNIDFIEPNMEEIEIYNSLENLETDYIFQSLLSNKCWFSKVTKLHNLLETAVETRISNQPKLCKLCINKNNCSHASVGILFSGGVDCSILALLTDRFIEKEQPIDLYNVSFDEINNFLSPDRKTGLETLEELKRICPKRNWRFVDINIGKKELDDTRSKHIGDLIYPLKTILDDSLGCSLWFASRGIQDSNCRVLLVGMGADELFGGYTKHRAAFKKESWFGLHTILNSDWDNLPYRNLARDDRVVSDHGRQLRTPYLDENVVNFVRSLHCWEKSYPSNSLPHGVGDKILLRSLAYHLGLQKTSSFKKRALQFGSRIANKKEVAHDISTRLRQIK